MGLVRLPKNKMEMLEKVDQVYKVWFRLWRYTYVPKLMFKPKWFKTDRDLLEGDLVYFVKRDGALENKWTIGMVESVDRGRDGVIRKATIKYCNSNEQKLSHEKGERNKDSTFPRYTERAVRKLVKIFSLEETCLADDMAELLQRMKVFDNSDKDASDENDTPAANTRLKAKCKVCCCAEHCEFKLHLPTRVLQEEKPLAMETVMDATLSMEKEDVPSCSIQST